MVFGLFLFAETSDGSIQSANKYVICQMLSDDVRIYWAKFFESSVEHLHNVPCFTYFFLLYNTNIQTIQEKEVALTQEEDDYQKRKPPKSH